MKKNIATLLLFFFCVLILTACSESKKSITKLDDLKKVSIGAMTGTTGEHLAKKRFPESTVKSFDDIMDAIAALKSSQLDAVITGFPTAMNVSKRNSDLHYLSEPVDFENTCIAVKKGNEKILSELNKFIGELLNDGTLKDMRRRWFKPDLSPYEEAEIILPKKGELLKIGTSATREPFCFVDKNRKVTGHDGELAKRISARLGRPIQFVDMKFSALIPALQSGKVDLIVAGMTATEERKKSVDFTDSYFQNSQVILVKKPVIEDTKTDDKTTKLKTIDDLKNKRIGVLLGSVHDTYALKNYPAATILQYKSPSELILAVRSGKVDAAIYTHETLQEILRSDKELKLFGDTLFTIPIAMGFNKNNSALREKFNQFLKKIKSDGTFKDMMDRWINKGETAMPAIKNSKSNGTLVVGTVSDKGLPFTVVKDNKLIGFDIELDERFAASLGKELKFVDMDFGSLIISAATNKIEMITSTLMITEERKKQIDFSDSYLRLGASVFAQGKNIDDEVKLKKMKTLDDIADKSVGVYEGTVNDGFVAGKYPNADIKRFNSSADMVLSLKSRKIDAALLDLISAKALLKTNTELTFLSEDALVKPLGIGFNKNNQALKNKFNNFLKLSKSNGTFNEIYQRWCVNDFDKAVMPVNKYKLKSPVLKLGVAVIEDLPYVSFINGKFVGLDIELLQKFAEHEGYQLEIVTMDFPALFTSLPAGKVDMIADGIAITEERQKKVDFSDSYMDYRTAVIVLKENIEASNSGKMSKLDDIANKSVGVYAGSIHDSYVQKHFPNAEAKQFTTVADMVLALKTKKIDAALFDLCAVKVLLKSNPEIGILTDKVLDLPVGYGFSKSNSALRESFNKFLQASKSDGTYDAIYKRWFVEDAEKAQMPKIEMDKNGKPITLGVAVGDLPNSAIVNNEHVGFDIELLKTFAKRNSFNMKIVTMEFSSLVAALASGKVDIIADGIAITAERQKQVDFSNPYNELQTAVIALKTNLAKFDNEVDNKEPEKPSSIGVFFNGIVESFHNNIVIENRYMLILDGLKTTAIISILSTIFGTLLGGLICFMRMSRRKILSLPAKFYISVLRGTPVLVVLMIIFYVVFASVDIEPTIVAVIAFGLNFAAYVSEMYRTGIEGVDKGQTEAGIAMGFTKVTTFIYIILPQAVKRILPVYKGEVISLVKMTSIVGYIAVQDLTKASDIIRSRTFDAFFPLIMVAVLYFLISWLLLLLLGYIERKSNPKLKLNRGL